MQDGKRKYKYWDEFDKEMLALIWETDSISDIAKSLGRSSTAVHHMAKKLELPTHKELEGKKYRRWTDEEKEYLCENWGEKDLNVIAKKLKRTIPAIKHMVRELELPSAQDASTYLTQREVARIMGVTNKKLAYWEQKRKIISFKSIKLCGKMTYKVIQLDKLLDVLKQHQDIWDANKVELYAFGEEPLWLQEKRKSDATKVYGNNNESWTAAQDMQLHSLWRRKVPQKEMAEALEKTPRAIRHRICKLRKEWIKNEQCS